jgi:6-pyruvoyltetrahydropterin/6-carboxytetrahydropterin synthase
MYELTVTAEFSAAHAIRDYNGPCERMHGHNYLVQVVVAGEHVNAQGLLVDFRDLKKALANVLDRLDHRNLNELEAFHDSSPTSEVIARYIYDELAGQINQLGARLTRVTVWETATASASYYTETTQERN